jgi:beta-galactosidase
MAYLARPLALGAVLLAVGAAFAALRSAPPRPPDGVEEWQDPAVTGRNREPAHATMLPYATVEQALEGTREASPFCRSLDGKWRFHYVSPADRPRDFQRSDFDDRGWPEIPVPSNWRSRDTTSPST